MPSVESQLSANADSPLDCYHCGLPVPQASSYVVRIGGQARKMCCVGCQAVAQSIVDNGLTEYYQHRDAMPEPQKEALPVQLQELGLFDHPDFQASFVQPVGEHEREASLILEGITCAACVWLNERHVASQPGVRLIKVNYATRRARVRWDVRETQLSNILAAIHAIGYQAYPYDAEKSEQVAQRERRSMLWRVFVAGFGMMQVMMYAYPSYVAGIDDLSADAENLMRWASLILTVPVVLYSAAPFFKRAWRDLRLRSLGMDVPVALGVGSAFVASVWGTLTNGPEVYFDSVTMFVFLLLCGRYLEMLARQRAVRGVEEMGKVLPAFAERVGQADGEANQRIPVSQLQIGDLILIRPGEVFPADGVVHEGKSEADEALLTGESRPVLKTPGALVTGGSLNIGSPLVVEVQKVGDATRLAAIRRLMDRASAERPEIATTADKVARVFILALLIVSVLTFALWQWLDPDRALWIFVSVLVVACPCALSLATPTALTVATDALARMGVLVTRGHAIEALATANHYVFDKTGTLTHGTMTVSRVQVLADYDLTTVKAVAAALESASEHAIGAGIRVAAEGVALPTVDGLHAMTGQGIEGRIEGKCWRIGRPEFVAALSGVALPPTLQDEEGASVIALGSEEAMVAYIYLNDQVRAEAHVLFDQLRTEKVPATIISGDGAAAVERVAAHFGVADCQAAMTPEGKQSQVAQLQKRDHAVVAMIGDGVNDAPVMAQAHVSIAMGGGTDLARNQADVVLLSENLAGLAAAVGLTRKTLRIIRQNLWWSFAYNFLSVPLAMIGLITPWMAGLGMAISSLLVVLNALRLQPVRRVRS